MLHTAKQMKPPTIWESLKQRFFAANAGEVRIFSEIDYYRLQALLTKQHLTAIAGLAAQLRQLRRLLNHGVLYPCKAVPSNLMTMNSTALLRSRRGTGFELQLVYPRHADRKARKVSVLSVLGLALIGKAEGDPVSDNMVIERILYQPESLGNYYL